MTQTILTVPQGGSGSGTLTGIVKGNGTSAYTAATSGTDYSAGTSALSTGIVKSTTTTGALTIAVAGDFPTLNQNTTGSAATLTTPRAINGTNFDGSAAITVTAAAGTLTGSTLSSGVTSSSLTSVGVINNLIEGYATTATAAGTTTLTVSSAFNQYFTGSTTQTVQLPVASTLVLGQSYQIINNSTGSIAVNSSGANLVTNVPGGKSAIVTCILASGTTAASWSVSFAGTSFKVTTLTRDTSLANGNISYTGVGFKPTSIMGFGGVAGGSKYSLMGFHDGSNGRTVTNNNVNVAGSNDDTGGIFYVISAAGAFVIVNVVSFDADGFTLSYTKTGSPTGTITMSVLSMR